jgi:hypothetical protein
MSGPRERFVLEMDPAANVGTSLGLPA